MQPSRVLLIILMLLTALGETSTQLLIPALGELERQIGEPVEIGVMAIATSGAASRTQDILALLNPYMLHFPLPDDKDLPTHAFPLSPASESAMIANPTRPLRAVTALVVAASAALSV